MNCAVYLIRSIKNKQFYTGISTNPTRRLFEHNSGKSKITNKHKPWELVYVKVYSGYQDARKHERWLKKKNVIYKNRLIGTAQLAPPVRGGVK
ncbi:MAG: GIY-YIG nuclease family protein [Patescibacteria group bacterium]|nr:GIY-YIG nuclease family protein [Patescibacteria group bacterium]MDD5121310.1 GIY-YIG nuclease family protein [Patescibacteria group bacterium]MDD5221740.1 GIY-YIG nuclease family protein [Patescibacteria group bacterium]MDD5395771.1 GIY-YIG nuclease family protein [Patescibacteria group bacterium]